MSAPLRSVLKDSFLRRHGNNAPNQVGTSLLHRQRLKIGLLKRADGSGTRSKEHRKYARLPFFLPRLMLFHTETAFSRAVDYDKTLDFR